MGQVASHLFQARGRGPGVLVAGAGDRAVLLPVGDCLTDFVTVCLCSCVHMSMCVVACLCVRVVYLTRGVTCVHCGICYSESTDLVCHAHVCSVKCFL